MSDIKRFIFERVSENIVTKPWMKACYRDSQTREIVMAAWPLNYAITLAWMLNLAWQRYRHRESWIDRMIASEARLKIIQLERERDEARAVAGELADVASKYLSFLLAVTPSKTNETHEKETMRVIDALKRWKEL